MGFTVILASGLPLHRETSFKRQLQLLGRALSAAGTEVFLTGPDLYESARARDGVSSAILLGYHDQFDFLNDDTGFPLLLWAQLSRPVDTGAFGKAVPVPITPVSKMFLKESKVGRIGPVIPHGIDTTVFSPFSHEERNTVRKRFGFGKEFVVGAVAANTRRKRLDLVIEAFARFHRRFGDAVLLIKTDRMVGLDGTDLRTLAEAQGVRHEVKILEGSFDEGRMAAVYNSMDLYLTLSEWEGFCIPVIEAMACGVPVVTHRVQGPGEIVPYDDLLVPGSEESYEEGTKLATADPDAAAEVLLRAYESGTLKNLGADGREVAVERYDIRKVVLQWIALIRNVSGREGISW